MGRPSPIERLNRVFRETHGSKAISTQQGRQGYDPMGYGEHNVAAFLSAIHRNRWGLDNVQIPYRNRTQAYLMQEIYAVCSPLARGIQELAGDAANDSQADTQPDAIVVNGETQSTAKKIEKILRDGFRRLKVGENGSQRHRIALRTGNCFGQKVFEWDGSRWHMTKIVHMPTYQMIRNPKDDSYVQMSVAGMSIGNPDGEPGVVARWPPGFIANLAVEADHNSIYGVPILEHVRVDYRLFVAACEDYAAASRSRAPLRFKWKYGQEKGFMSPAPEALEDWKKRQQIEPTTVLTDIWLIAGWEDVEEIGGDAAGVAALMMGVNDHMHRMKKACGFRTDEEELAGAGREAGDARYSSHINTLRIADWKFKKSIGDDLLLLEGYDDIDWATNIPPLGETDTNRVTRASNELKNAHGGLRTYAAAVGLKSVDTLKDDIRETKEFYDELEIVWPQGNKVEAPLTDQERSPKGDVPGTESPKKGSDPEKGRQRREQQRRAGRTPTGA